MRVLVHHARFGELLARRLREADATFEVVLHVDEGSIAPDIERFDVVIGMRFPVGMLARAHAMRLLHLTGVGTDHIDGVRDDVVIGHAGAAPARAVAEFACGAALALAHGVTPVAAVRPRTRLLVDGTMVIVGFGRIGRALAARARSLGMNPLVVVRDATRVDLTGRSSSEVARGIEFVDGPDALLRAAMRADVLVPAVPRTASTHHLVDAGVLDALPPDSLVLNIARHDVVDEASVVARLRSGRLAGALLDVHEREPLPADDPLWDVPGLLVTPHCAYRHESHADDVATLCVDAVMQFARAGQSAQTASLRDTSRPARDAKNVPR